MQFYRQNSIKHNLFRVIAGTITLCYILGLAQLPLRSILHTISHNLEIPSYILQHDEVDNNDYVNQLKSGTNVGNHDLNHQHKVLDFLDEIFDEQSNDNKNHNGETTTVDFKLNKHITSSKYNFIFQNSFKMDKPEFWITHIFYKNGYLEQLYRPPKV
ncbi:hypothetical protein [uncultured Winogradskyella sp.]|uniref:hypothetical protein n=1 Tax=uncultured Winogradskyella sp. TaxID=395353 RepID=UPI002633C20C|nr:hypothetical protein [uncultured Winogradskyella sp.]